MNNVSGYGIYQNAGMVSENLRRFGGAKAEGHEKNAENAANKAGEKRTDNVNGILNGVELSEGAKKILEELKEKYGNNTDFFVASYSTEEEAQDYLSRGTKEYSVLIEPELLEEMARDSEAKEKYMGIIENGTKQLDEMKEELAKSGKDGDVKNIGFSVKADGTISFFAQLEQNAKAQAERIAEKREKNAEKAEKEAEKRAEKLREKRENYPKDQIKKATIKADSADELLDKIKNFDWEAVKAEEKIMIGSKVDFTA